jgi:fructose-1,6-bisphosphatase
MSADSTTSPLHTLDHAGPIVTLQGHLLATQASIPGATGTLSWILSALSISAKIIANKVRCARLQDVLGEAGADNVQGEQQQKLDVISNAVLLRLLGQREGVAIVASEENEEPVIIRDDPTGERRYCVLFDPLDGSSNLDVCAPVGTIFSILRHERRQEGRAREGQSSLLQPGREQVAAGYVLYGSSTVFVLTVGNGVDMFVLDPAVGAFMLVQRGLQTPTAAKSYSLNEGNRRTFPAAARLLVALHRLDGRGRAPDPAEGRRVHVSADEEGTGRQAATDVRGQSDGDADRAGRRPGPGRTGSAHPRRAADGHSPAHAGDPRQRRGSAARRRAARLSDDATLGMHALSRPGVIEQ